MLMGKEKEKSTNDPDEWDCDNDDPMEQSNDYQDSTTLDQKLYKYNKFQNI